MVGVTGDSKPLLCIKYAIKYGQWDSNPQGSKPGDFKSPMFTDFITPAYY